MIDFKDSVFYIWCPAKAVTWWPECLHQLADKLTNMGLNVKVFYWPQCENPAPDVYKKYYKFSIAEDIIDSEKNYLIFPEIWVSKLCKYSKINKILWRLSIDNAERNIPVLWSFSKKIDFWYFWNWIINYINQRLWSIVVPKDQNLLHLFQSKYAENYILNKGVKVRWLFLQDYLNKEFILSAEKKVEKEDIVVYNPKKWFKYTKKLISYWSKFWIKFIPIKNMNPMQVSDLLMKSKVYIDFWYHPWRDRMPREAVMKWCCIITNTTGSANFYDDIPIPADYSFNKFNAPKIISKIRDIFEKYDYKKSDFDFYRNIVFLWEKRFEQQIIDILSVIKNKF